MSIESDLKKEGIKILAPLDTLTVNSIAKSVAEKLCNRVPELNLNYEELFMKLSRLSMYIADIPQGMAEANYCYRNSSIYFSSHLDFSQIDNFAIHECIHYLQEVRDKSGSLLRLGLCDFTEFKAYGIALNEAAVQMIASKASNDLGDNVKYYGISIQTCSPNYYPLLCNLGMQMAYITGEYPLFHSAYFSTDQFKEKFISLCGEKSFYQVQKGFDTLLSTEEEIIILTNKMHQGNYKEQTNQKILKKIEQNKEKMKQTFLQVQNTILTSYFNHLYHQIYTLEDIENFRKRLYHFKDYIGTTEDYTFFNTYYINTMDKIEKKHEQLQQVSTALITVPTNRWATLFKSIRKLFSKMPSYEYHK